jgi:hypothetical protein
MAKHAADKIETKDVREAFARLVRKMVAAELIAKTIADGVAQPKQNSSLTKGSSRTNTRYPRGRSVASMQNLPQSTAGTISR